MTSIKFAIFYPDEPWSEITDGSARIEDSRTFLADPDCADTCVSVAVEKWFDGDAWNDIFGDDDNSTVLVEIIEPAVHKGVYEVAVERITHARANRTNDPRPKEEPAP